MMLDGLGLAQFGREFLVFLSLPGLTLQVLKLVADLADDILEAFEVGLGGFETQFRLVTAAMQPGDAYGVFQNTAAILRLGVDEFADLPLLHQRLAARARGGVREQKLHVAGAGLLAVDLVDGAGLALDAARDFKRIAVVEGGGGGAGGVVEHDRHLGHVAPRSGIRAREDHVVHGGRAHALVGGFAHHPAQGFEQIGLAAPVRADDTGEPGLDEEFGGFDEGFEPQKPQPRDLHSGGPLSNARGR